MNPLEEREIHRKDSNPQELGAQRNAEEGQIPDLSLQPIPVDAYYDAARKEYLLKTSRGRWLHNNAADFKMKLRKMGFSTKIPGGAQVSPAEEVMISIQDRRDVSYSGPLAGRNEGFYDEDGIRFLVTESPHVIAPAKGEWETLRHFLDNLVGNDPEGGATQKQVLYGWLKCSVAALASGRHQPGQALGLAGPVGCGKSLLQSLITLILGGRVAKPFRYLSGATDFNADLFGAEHLALEDEHSSTDMRGRMQLAANIKGIAVNETHSCHGKHQNAITLRPFWRLTISLNDQPENLSVLPPLTPDIADKIILLKCSAPAHPFPTGNPDLRAKYWSSLTAELPAFTHFLTEWTIPPELKSERFGVTHFHHPELSDSLDSLSPESKLLDVIDRTLWKPGASLIWKGTASELESVLLNSPEASHEAKRLFHWSNACGTYLGRLAEKYPSRFQPRRSGVARRWDIHPPKS